MDREAAFGLAPNRTVMPCTPPVMLPPPVRTYYGEAKVSKVGPQRSDTLSTYYVALQIKCCRDESLARWGSRALAASAPS